MGPLRILILLAMLGMVGVMLSVWSATHTPWLGFTVAPCVNAVGVCVQTVAPESPAQGLLLPGVTLSALSADSSQAVEADTLWTVSYPYELTSYSVLNHFVTQQRELYRLLKQPTLSVVLSSGIQVKLNPVAHRPITDLSLDFWLIALIGYGGLLISCGVWCFHRSNIATRLFALSGCGFFMMAQGIANFSTRELTVAANALPYLLQVERAGDFLLAYSWCALLWYYPTPLMPMPIISLMMVLSVLLLINETLQIWQFPIHAFMVADFLIPFIFCVIFATLQWQKAKNNPVARAVIKWFLLSFVLSISLLLILQYVPLILGAPSVAPLWLSFAAFFILYFGILSGISRYRLFDLEGWWLNIWSWLAGGFAVFILDAVLIFTLDFYTEEALWLAVIIVGWCYFPLRQWLWKYLSRDNQQPIESYLPHLNALLAHSIGGQNLDAYWRRLLKRIFDPLNIRTTTEPLASPQLHRNGLVLTVPEIKNTKTITLTARNKGKRLFTRKDQGLALALLELAQQSLRLQQTQTESVLLERVRILRDLHDDVAAPLMMLAHRAETPEYRKLASNALMALRETVHGLQQTDACSLAEMLADWRTEARERLEAADVALYWEEGVLPKATMTPHERINLARVLREALSNALTHAQPRVVKISTTTQGRRLRLIISDDGTSSYPESWVKQTGLTSMQRRVTEMNGKISWHANTTRGTSVEVLLPLRILEESNENSELVSQAHQTQADSLLSSLCTGADIQLTVNSLDMASDGIRRDTK